MKAFEDIRKVSDLSDGEKSAAPLSVTYAMRPRDASEIYHPRDFKNTVLYVERSGDAVFAKLSNGASVPVNGGDGCGWLIV